jgi:hypothetical protein
LLRLAAVLAGDAGGHPRWVARNGAVSTAYYAVFHALAEMCGRELVGAWRPWAPFRHVYRSLDHGQARRVLDAARREIGAPEPLKRLADIFTDLQEQRHGADYDPGYRVTAGDLAAIIDRAGQAIEVLADLPAADRKLLAARLIGRTRN